MCEEATFFVSTLSDNTGVPNGLVVLNVLGTLQVS